MSRVYIIISAYKADKLIKQCLDAACPQGNVILGIDGCEQTLNVVNQIRKRYTNLRVIWFPENKGCYLTKNALIDYVPKKGVFVTFDADDVMRVGMVRKMKRHMPCYSRHPGVMCITKTIWDELGGFRPWRVGADTDFIHRLKLVHKVGLLPKLYIRRMHSDQLTKVYGKGSDVRKEVVQLIADNMNSEQPQIYFKPEKNVGKEI